MRESFWPSLWPRLIASFCCIGIIILLAACGDSSASTPPNHNDSQTVTALQETTPSPTGVSTPTASTQVTPNPILVGAGPAARNLPQLAYDKRNGTLVLFGGNSFNGYLQDTWTWDGHTWMQQHPTASPGPILGASMAYDDATGLVVLFGGEPQSGQQAMNDTWTWDGHTWTHLHPALAPPPRGGANMVYDAASGQVVLFGGYNPETKSLLNDTWTWNGTTWTQQHPAVAPSARLNASMAYDASTRTAILFGGDDLGAPIPLLTDTWTWNGATWTQQHPATSPAVRFTSNGILYGAYPNQTSMVWNEATQQILLTLAGGDNTGDHRIQISWTWDGSNWTQQSIQHLLEPDMYLFYSTAQRTVYAFADTIDISTFEDSLWQWNGRIWQPATT